MELVKLTKTYNIDLSSKLHTSDESYFHIRQSGFDRANLGKEFEAEAIQSQARRGLDVDEHRYRGHYHGHENGA